jgi:hypothetical protein
MRGDMEQWCELILSADFPNPILKRLKIRRTRPKAYLGNPELLRSPGWINNAHQTWTLSNWHS